MRRPAFQFYPGDWLRDAALRSCSVEARGLWIDLLCFMHDGIPYGHLALKDGPISERDAAKMVGVELKTYRRLVRELERRNVLSCTPAGVLYSRRMVRDEEIRQARAKGGVKSLGHPNVPPPKTLPKDTMKDIHKGPPQGGDGGGSPAVAVAVAVAGKSKTKRSAPKSAPTVTWLTPFGDAWQRTYGGKPAFGELAKHLKLLTDDHPPGEVLEHWERYLVGTDAKYASPARFAQTYGRWGKPVRAKEPMPDAYLTLEEQEARRAQARPSMPPGVSHIGPVVEQLRQKFAP